MGRPPVSDGGRSPSYPPTTDLPEYIVPPDDRNRRSRQYHSLHWRHRPRMAAAMRPEIACGFRAISNAMRSRRNSGRGTTAPAAFTERPSTLVRDVAAELAKLGFVNERWIRISEIRGI